MPVRKGRRPAIILSFIIIVLTIAAIWPLRKAWAIGFSGTLLAIVAYSFLHFAFDMIRNVRQRTSMSIVVLVIVHVGSIIALFANLYRWIGIRATSDPPLSSHSFSDALYFSIVTWTTLGYGDIVPKANARGITSIEALLGYVAMALLIAVLTAIAQSKPAAPAQPAPAAPECTAGKDERPPSEEPPRAAL